MAERTKLSAAEVLEIKRLKQENPTLSNELIGRLADNRRSATTVRKVLLGDYDNLLAQANLDMPNDNGQLAISEKLSQLVDFQRRSDVMIGEILATLAAIEKLLADGLEANGKPAVAENGPADTR